MGWVFIFGIIFVVIDIFYFLSSENDVGGYVIVEMFYLVFKSRYGNGIGGIFCLGIVVVVIFFCGMSLVISNLR